MTNEEHEEFGWLSGDDAREYTRQRAEELRLLREKDATLAREAEKETVSRGLREPPLPMRSFSTPNPRSSSCIIDHIEHWWCPSCCAWVPRKLMGRRKKRWNGLDVYCRQCKREKTRRSRR